MTQRLFLAAAIAALLTPALFSSNCSADIVLTAVGAAVGDDFDAFRGDGFSPTPSSTQLDSNTYRATGLSDGNGAFGGTHTTGDFARGSSTGGVSTGGIYGFDVGGGDFAVGVQPTGGDFTPGSFTIRALNMTGQSVNRLEFDAQAYFFNDQDRSSRWTVELSLDDTNYQAVSVLDSDETADTTPAWALAPISAAFNSPIAVADGQQFYIRITGEDLSGSGSRDEFALGEFSITVRNAIPEPGSAGLCMLLATGLAFVRRRRK